MATTVAVVLLSCAPLGGARRGGASMDVVDPAVGLSSLGSYRAELQLRFEGTKDGEPLIWSQTLSLAVDRAVEGRLLSVETGEAGTGLVTGLFGQVHYTSSTTGGECLTTMAERGNPPPEIPEVAGLLPPIHGASPAGPPESFEGNDVVRYTLDGQSVTMTEGAEVEGEAVIAAQGGYLARYSLRVTGGADQFGDGTIGEMQWTYELHDINQPLDLQPPAGCPQGDVDVPMPEEARDVVRRPGFLTFVTDLDIVRAGEFYEERLPNKGWQASPDNLVLDNAAFLIFTRADQRLVIQVRGVGETQVWLLMEAVELPGQQPTESTPTASGSETLAAIISSSLNRTLGIGQDPVLPSYHLSASGAEPAWDPDSGQALVTNFTVEADVAGNDLHLIRTTTAPGQSAVTVEGYVVSGRDYEVRPGELREALGQVSLDWAAWPLNAVTALAIASTGPEPRGSEAIEGRVTDVYDLDSAQAPPATLEMIRGLLNVASARGTVWIDRETGALLKADLTYEIEFPDPSKPDNILGTGGGQVTIAVSKVGGVTVTLP